MMRCRRPLLLSSVVAVVAFSLLAAGCGGGGSPGVANVASSTTAATTPTTQNGLLAFSQCMRSHGMPNFPDPQRFVGGNVKLTIHQLATIPGGHECLQSPAPDERRQRVAGNGPAAAHPARGRAVVRQVHAQPWCQPLPRSDRAGSS